jgi:hypothetical protein
MLLLGACILGVIRAYAMPVTVEEELTLVNYRHKGTLDYVEYVNPSYLFGNSEETTTEEDGGALYFTDIIDGIEIQYSYEFLPDDASLPADSEAKFVAIITGPSKWQQTIDLYTARNLGSHFELSFPLRLETFDDLVDTLEVELGFRQPDASVENSYTLDIEARVNVWSDGGSQQINDSFVHPVTVRVGKGTLLWDNQLHRSQRETVGGLSYKHMGNFNYRINLKQNSLYDTASLGPEEQPPPTPTGLLPDEITFIRLTDVIKANFAYEFYSNRPVRNLKEEVTVTAVLEFPDFWQKKFVLVPKTARSGDFDVAFSLDVNSFNEFANAVKAETGMGPPTHQLNLIAEVHTTADTDFGPIDDVFTQTLEGEIGGTVIIWNQNLERAKAGSIIKRQEVPNPEKLIGLPVSGARGLFPWLTVILSAFCIFLGIMYIPRERMAPSNIEREARQAKKRYKDFIADVEEIGDVKDAVVIPVTSLPNIIAIAQGLLKPVLHKAEAKKHTYWILDGMTKYEYISTGTHPVRYRRRRI